MSFDQSIFRAYDIRGLYPSQYNEDVAYALGQAFVKVMGAKRVAVGRDVRTSGESLQAAMINGVTDAGATAIDIGVISTEMLYFAAGTLDCDGGMSITASHNPPEWNGTKFIGKGGDPLTREEKLGEIYAAAQANETYQAPEKGVVETVDLLPAYAEYLQRFAPSQLPRTIRVAMNVNFGANGKVVDATTKNLDLEIQRLNWNEDGTFPKGTPDPLLPKNQAEIERILAQGGFDFGAAFDADADRCFFYDETGRFFSGYYIAAMLIRHFLPQDPGGTVVIDPRLMWANLDAARESGGTAAVSKTGHGYMKKAMRDHDAIFGGENSAHYFYRDFFFCDNGLVTFLTALGIFATEIAAGRKVSELLDWYMEHYPITMSELNYITDQAAAITEEAKRRYADAEMSTLDGVSIEYPDWRFNLRMSNNEPVLRLNLEAKTPAERDARLAEVRGLIEGYGATLRDDTK